MALLCNASLKPAFFNGAIDSKTILFLLPLALHPSYFTFAMCVGVGIFYSVLSYFGITAEIMYRRFRAKCRGSIVYATPLMWKKRKVYD